MLRAPVLLRLATLPLLLLAWAVLAFARWPLGEGDGVGPPQAIGALALLAPVMAYWTRIAPAQSPGLRRAAIVGAVAALCAARPEVWITAPPAWLSATIIGASVVLFAPAAFEWAGRVPDWARLRAFLPAPRALAGPAFDVTFAVALPLVLLLAGPIQRFPPPGWVDPGLYLGLALDLPHHLLSYNWNYHALRVSYVLPTYLLHQLLPPVPARLAIVVLFHLLATVSLYAATRTLWGRAAAAVAVTLLACNPVFLLAVTAGYVDAAFVAYLLLLLAALAAWSRGGGHAPLVLAGAAAALAVLAHPLAAAPAGIILLSFAVLGWERVAARPFRVIGAGILGAFCVWAFFAFALSRFGFGLGAFGVMRWAVQASAEGIGVNYRAPLGDWLPRATRLVPGPLLLLALGALLVRRASWGGASPGAGRKLVAMLLLLALTVALLPVYDVVLGGSVTQSAFYAGLSLPGIAIASGAVAAMLLPRGGPARAAVVLATVLLTYGAAWFAPTLWQSIPSATHSGALLAVGAGLSVLVLLPPRAPAARFALLPAVAGLCALAVNLNADTRTAFRPQGAVSNVEFFRASIFVNDLLSGLDRAERAPLFWFEREAFTMRDGRSREFLRPLRFRDTVLPLSFYDSLAALRLWDVFLFSPRLRPGMPVDRDRLLRTSAWTLVIPYQGPEELEVARALLGANRIACRPRPGAIHQSDGISLGIAFLDVLGARDEPSARCDDPEPPRPEDGFKDGPRDGAE